jgi:hypothetical protein
MSTKETETMTETTASLRSRARELAARGDFAEAGRLYRRALEIYPGTGGLADLDRRNLAAMAISCEVAAEHGARCHADGGACPDGCEG